MRICSCSLVAALVLIPFGVQAAPNFPAHDDYPAGTTTIGVGIGDIDGDGDQDLIGANGNGNSVTVMRNRGNGRFDVLASYPTGAGASAVVMRDWNADGFTDVAVACGGSNGFTTYLGRASASLDSRVDVVVGSVGTATDIVAADFDRDGRFDIAVSDLVRSAVAIFIGNGNGTFTRRADWSAPRAPYGLVAADLNGDDLPDIATANRGSNDVSILLGEGDGSMGPVLGPFPVGGNPVRIAAEDLNGDGHLDLVTANRGPAHSPDSTISVLIGDGTGTFTRGQDRVSMIGPEAVALSDLDGDANLDAAVVHVGIPGFVSIFPGRGDGSFLPRTDVPTGSSPRAVATGDLNGDGSVDIATANYFDNTLSVLLNAGTVTAVDRSPTLERPLTLVAAPSPSARELHFTLQGEAHRSATLKLFDVRGRLAAAVFEGRLPPNGRIVVRWDGRARSGATLPSGIYFARLQSGSESVTLRIIRLR